MSGVERDKLAWIVAAGMWGDDAANLYFDPRYDGSPDIRRGQSKHTADRIMEYLAAQGLDAATIERCAQVADFMAEQVRQVIKQDGIKAETALSIVPTLQMAEGIGDQIRRLNTASTTTRGEKNDGPQDALDNARHIGGIANCSDPSVLAVVTSGEDARLREALIRAALCLSGFVGEGICIEGYEEPDEVYLATVELLGMEDADDDDLRAALQGDAAHTSQEKGE